MGKENSLQIDTKGFYKEICAIAFPIIIQQLILVSVNFADTLMVGKLSEYALAAVGTCNQIYFIVIDCMFGFLSGCAVYAVQYWGIKDLKSLRKILGISYLMIIIFTIPITAIVYFCAPTFIGIYSKDPIVVELGVQYIRVACFTYLFSGLTFTVSYYSRAVEKLKWPTIINVFAIMINIFLNYCMIFGNFGFKEMGVRGAALATLIARIFECTFVFIYVYIDKSHPLSARFKDLIFENNLYKRVMKTAAPVILNELLWVLSFSYTFAIYGKIDAVALAIVEVSLTINDIFQCVFTGLANSCSVIVGKALGQGKKDEAYFKAKKCTLIGMGMSILSTLLLIVFRTPIALCFDFETNTFDLLIRTLFVFALTMTSKMMGYILICGIIRPGGDTSWCFFVDAGLNWVVQVPLALLSVCVLNLSIEYCIAIVAVSDVIKTLICYIRFKSRKWENVFTGR